MARKVSAKAGGRVRVRPKTVPAKRGITVRQSPHQGDRSPNANVVSDSAPSNRVPIVLVGALSALSFERPSYQMPPGIRAEVLALLEIWKLETTGTNFLDRLSELIARYQVFRRQDRDTLRSERAAIEHLAHARDKANALLSAYQKACEYFPGTTRLMTAFSALQAARPTDIAGIPIVRTGPPDTLGRLEEALYELCNVLNMAAAIPPSKSPKGGRPDAPRARHFVIEFHALVKAALGDSPPSIRGGPLKRILRIALHEVGWTYTDLRPFLDAVEKPKPRKKPPALGQG